MCAINGGTFNRNAMNRRLNDGILLGMHSAADLVALSRRHLLLVADTAQFQTIFYAGASTIISR